MGRTENKSIKVNMLLNSIKSLMGVVFPLITFPYISRILGIDNIGKYNFANSVISYFVLLAGLGISTYGIRTGSELRNDQEKLQTFVNKVFTINVYSTLLSYCLLGVCFLFVEKFQDYTALLIILSGQIFFKTLGIEWIYSIYEDYAYITIRSIVLQLISLLLMFVFVRDIGDVELYAGITVFSSVGSNLLNFFHAKKYCKVRCVKKIDLRSHFKPIMIFFATTVTVVIYVNSDSTILGFLCSDYTVGIYAVSVNVYKALKIVLSAIIVVSIPRMSLLWGRKKYNEFAVLGKEIYQTFLTLVFPAIFGVIILSKEIVYFISGAEYAAAQSSLIILSISLLFCIGAGFYSQGILIPQNKESLVFKITIISAIINIVLNLLLIPIWEEKAAAFTTLVAEAIVFFYCKKKAKKSMDSSGNYKLILKVIVGCVPIIFIYYLVRIIIADNIFLRTVLVIMLSVMEYVLIEVAFKNEIVLAFFHKIITKIK